MKRISESIETVEAEIEIIKKKIQKETESVCT